MLRQSRRICLEEDGFACELLFYGVETDFISFTSPGIAYAKPLAGGVGDHLIHHYSVRGFRQRNVSRLPRGGAVGRHPSRGRPGLRLPHHPPERRADPGHPPAPGNDHQRVRRSTALRFSASLESWSPKRSLIIKRTDSRTSSPSIRSCSHLGSRMRTHSMWCKAKSLLSTPSGTNRCSTPRARIRTVPWCGTGRSRDRYRQRPGRAKTILHFSIGAAPSEISLESSGVTDMRGDPALNITEPSIICGLGSECAWSKSGISLSGERVEGVHQGRPVK